MKNNIRLLFILIILSVCSSKIIKIKSVDNDDTSELPFNLNKSIFISLENINWKIFGPFDEKTAYKFLHDRKEVLLNLLAPNIDPYKGTDPTPALCQTINLPKTISELSTHSFTEAFSFYSSDTKVLGLCADENHLIKTQYQILYCKNSRMLFIVQYFYTKKSEWLNSLIASCK